ATGASALWQPAVGTKWQIVLQNPLDMSGVKKMTPDVPVYDIDLFTNTDDGADKARVIGKLHSLGKKVICYFSAGTYEPYRPDAKLFKQSDLGATLPEWDDENWLDIKSSNVRSIMAQRIKMAADVGCDAIDPDNVDVYNNQNGGGFKPALTQADSINYIRFLATEAKKYDMAMGLKNAIEIVPSVIDWVQFAVNEECTAYKGDCETLGMFVDGGKPVFHIEYPDEDKYYEGPTKGFPASVRAQHCAAAGEPGFSTIIATYDLSGWVQWCDAAGSIYVTPT
ncbi:glycoside hydrolase superfamily, partial [Microdochium trichocladiopsis]